MCMVDEAVHASRDDCRAQHPVGKVYLVRAYRLHVTTNTTSSPGECANKLTWG